MTVLAIDPGPEQSAYVVWDGRSVQDHGKDANDLLRGYLGCTPLPVVIEQIASYGMAVGAEVFETCVWTGRFMEAASRSQFRPPVIRLPRRDVKLHLCGSARAKDSNIRHALIDRFGGKEKAIGTKASPGPLYGLKADTWQALALAVTWLDLHGQPARDETAS